MLCVTIVKNTSLVNSSTGHCDKKPSRLTMDTQEILSTPVEFPGDKCSFRSIRGTSKIKENSYYLP